MNIQSQKNTSRKSFWQKPEGITGLITFGLLGYGFYKILPNLIEFAENTIYLGAMVGGITLLSYLIIDNKSLIWYMYKTAMFKITNFFYRIDPIAVAKIYIKHLREKKEDIGEQIEKLNGSIKKTEMDIEENNKQISENSIRASEAPKFNMNSQAMLAAKDVIRLQDWNRELQPLVDNMKKTQSFMKKMYEIADYIIKDKESEISIMEKKYKSIKIAVSALRSAQDVMGQNEKEAGFEQAMEFIKEDMANKLGEMDRILEMATPYINELDLQNAIEDKKAMELLNSFNEEAFKSGLNNLTIKNTSPIILENKTTKQKSSGLVLQEEDNSFDHYFKK
jgi:hypothetical protein